ncbi:hypothetical protein Gorai_024549, partial [Gossypium raimondii]|nr:hypothetical protein [Gossypium raimondii]
MSETLSMVEFVVKASPASSNFGIGHATKKGRRQLDLPLDSDGPTVDKNGRKIPKLVVSKKAPNLLLLHQRRERILNCMNEIMHNHWMRDLIIRYHRKPMKSNGRLKRKTMGCDCWLNTGNDKWDRARVMRETIIMAIMVAVPGLVSLS